MSDKFYTSRHSDVYMKDRGRYLVHLMDGENICARVCMQGNTSQIGTYAMSWLLDGYNGYAWRFVEQCKALEGVER